MYYSGYDVCSHTLYVCLYTNTDVLGTLIGVKGILICEYLAA